jgi:hypothetical protein
MRLHPLGDLVSAGSPVSSLGPQSLGLILPLSQFPTGHFPRYPAHSTIAIPRFQRIVSTQNVQFWAVAPPAVHLPKLLAA